MSTATANAGTRAECHWCGQPICLEETHEGLRWFHVIFGTAAACRRFGPVGPKGSFA